MTPREHAAELNEAAIRWASGDRTGAEDEALEAAVERFRQARGDYRAENQAAITRASLELREHCIRELSSHGVPVTTESIAACRTAVSSYAMAAQADRDLLERLVQAIEGTIAEPSTELRMLLEEAYAEGIERPAELEEPSCARCSCTSERACADGCFWASVEPPICSACLTGPEIDAMLEALSATSVGLHMQAEHLLQLRERRIVLPSSNNLGDWAGRLGRGEDADVAAVAVGGTGRPR
jgi:hypothetical protein